MNEMEMLIWGLGLLLLLYIAYKLGKFVIKVVLGLAVIALVVGLAWHYFVPGSDSTAVLTGMKDQVEDLYKTLTSSQQGQELLKEVQAFSEQAKRIGKEKLAEFKEKQLPAIKEKARKYKEELDRQGKLKEAQEFWDRFTRWVKEFD
jgi:hypothetical protein